MNDLESLYILHPKADCDLELVTYPPEKDACTRFVRYRKLLADEIAKFLSESRDVLNYLAVDIHHLTKSVTLPNKVNSLKLE